MSALIITVVVAAVAMRPLWSLDGGGALWRA